MNYKDYARTFFLENMQEAKARFFAPLSPDAYNILGVPTPSVRKIAKEVTQRECAKELLEAYFQGFDLNNIKNYGKVILKEDFLKIESIVTHEDRLLYGFTLTHLLAPLSERLHYLDKFIPLIYDWAICDSVIKSLKFTKEELEDLLHFITSLLKEDSSMKKRIGLILLMGSYIDEENLTIVFDKIRSISFNGYYDKMACAWLIAEVATRYPKEAYDFLKSLDDIFDSWVFNKAISKICESVSKKVSKEYKESVRKLKRR